MLDVPVDAQHPVTCRFSYFNYESTPFPYVVFGDDKCNKWFMTPFDGLRGKPINDTLKNVYNNVFILDYKDPQNIEGGRFMTECKTNETIFTDDMKRYAINHVKNLVDNQQYVYGPLSLDQLINHCTLTAFGIYAA